MIVQIYDDMNLERIAESGQCFRWRDLGDNAYGIPHLGRYLVIRDLGEGSFELSCDENEYQSIWRVYFDLDTDYRSVRERISTGSDVFLQRACESEKGIRILRQDLWETLISFIISQNRNIPAIKRSIELLCRASGSPISDKAIIFGEGALSPEEDTIYAFPTPDQIVSAGERALSECALGYRDRYIMETAGRVSSGEYDLSALSSMDDADTLRRLMELCGVGVKVANCVLLFGLHRLDAFPVDVWMKKILQEQYPQGYPMSDYSPYNGIYQQYMFAYYRKL